MDRKASPEWGPLGAGGEVTSVHSTHRLLCEGAIVAKVLFGYDTPCMLSLEGRKCPSVTVSTRHVSYMTIMHAHDTCLNVYSFSSSHSHQHIF